MSKTKKIELDILEDTSWLEFYRENPVMAAQDLLIRNDRNLVLPPHQRIILKDLWSGTPFVMEILTRGGGKSTINGIYFTLRGTLFPGERLGIISGSYRQAKATFEEIMRFYNDSPILQRCSKKAPSKGNDSCIWDITDNGSTIRALPLGDGSKLRGQRFFRIFLDEFPKIDKSIVTEVLIPMLATRKNPTAPLSASEDKNQLILASTSTWQFNWGYQFYLDYKAEIEKGNPQYSLHEFDCDDIGDFMDRSIIDYSKKHSPKVIFLMEYKLLWPRDSEGWFPASLVEKVKKSFCLIELKGKKDSEYVLGIDPARESDYFAISVVKVEGHSRKLVNLIAIHKPTYPEMAGVIRQLRRDYNVVRIAIDYGGGGLAVRDQLAEESAWLNPKTGEYENTLPILPIDEKQFPERFGERILDIVYFSPKEIHQMNVDLKSDMEHERISIPREPMYDDGGQDKVYKEIVKLEDELRNITATVRPSGVIHFDTPSKRMIKDRYTSLMLANKAAKDWLKEKEKVVTGGKEELAGGFWI